MTEENASRFAAAGASTTSAVVDALLGRMRDRSTPPAGRQRLAQALGELRGTRARAELTALTDDADPVVARIAGYLAGRLQPDGSSSGQGDDPQGYR